MRTMCALTGCGLGNARLVADGKAKKVHAGPNKPKVAPKNAAQTKAKKDKQGE